MRKNWQKTPNSSKSYCYCFAMKSRTGISWRSCTFWFINCSNSIKWDKMHAETCKEHKILIFPPLALIWCWYRSPLFIITLKWPQSKKASKCQTLCFSWTNSVVLSSNQSVLVVPADWLQQQRQLMRSFQEAKQKKQTIPQAGTSCCITSWP